MHKLSKKELDTLLILYIFKSHPATFSNDSEVKFVRNHTPYGVVKWSLSAAKSLKKKGYADETSLLNMNTGESDVTYSISDKGVQRLLDPATSITKEVMDS